MLLASQLPVGSGGYDAANMGEGPKSIVNVTLPEEATKKLVEETSQGIGGIFKPWQIKRVAKAKAVAARTRAESEIEVADLHRRAEMRRAQEDVWYQRNMEQIAGKATPLLTDGSQPDKVEDDWMANFFDKARSVSNEQMQSLWARVLAGESNAPGAFSRRTINTLANLDLRDAEYFTTLCRFTCRYSGEYMPIIFSHNDKMYTSHGLGFPELEHLEHIGLVSFEPGDGSYNIRVPSEFSVEYHGTTFALRPNHPGGCQFDAGKVILSIVGQELASVCTATPIPGFADYLRARWRPILRESPTG